MAEKILLALMQKILPQFNKKKIKTIKTGKEEKEFGNHH